MIPIPELLKYFAIALFGQIAFVIVCGAAIIAAVQFEAFDTAKFLVMPIFILYAWPLGRGGIFLTAPLLLATYSLIFSVVEIRLRDR